MEALLDISGQDDDEISRAEAALCIAIGEDLMRRYPGYVWDVGFTHASGVVTVKLTVPLSVRPGGQGEPGFLIHAATCVGPGGQSKVHAAGGEILERWRLPREKAPADWVEMAWENGLDRTNMITKSKH